MPSWNELLPHNGGHLSSGFGSGEELTKNGDDSTLPPAQVGLLIEVPVYIWIKSPAKSLFRKLTVKARFAAYLSIPRLRRRTFEGRAHQHFVPCGSAEIMAPAVASFESVREERRLTSAAGCEFTFAEEM